MYHGSRERVAADRVIPGPAGDDAAVAPARLRGIVKLAEGGPAATYPFPTSRFEFGNGRWP